MGVGFGGLQIARSGLFVSERGLDVTGHNISNVNTPGYARQQAISATASYQDCITYQLGLGADIQEVRQIRHIFLDNVYRNESKTLGYWETKQNTYLDIQSIMGETFSGDENGLQSALNQFWDTWQELSKDPANLTVRATVKQRGEMLAEYVNHLGAQLEKAQTDLDLEIRDKINEINGLTSNIAKLNLQIRQMEIGGDHANDLRDQRNLAIDKLSKLIDCQAYEMQDGMVDVTVGGYFLVSKADAETITAVQNTTGSMFIAPAINGGKTLLPVKGGELKGLLESRGEVTGNKISLNNGNFSDKIDLVFAFNTNDTVAQRNNLLANIDSIVKYYKDRGISVRLGYTTFDSTGTTTVPTTIYSSLGSDGSSDLTDFKSKIGSIAFNPMTADGKCTAALQDIMTDTDAVDLASGWQNATRQIVLLSNNAIDSSENMAALAGKLKAGNVHTLVVSDSINEDKLGILATATGDRFMDSTEVDADTMDDVVSESLRNCIYGSVTDTGNSIPDVKRSLNLIINAVIREVNNLQKSGMTLGAGSHSGEDFFVPIDPNYPMQMGNIMLNPNLANLSNIVASSDGASGDNTIALAISDLRNSVLLGNIGDVQSIDGFYQSLIMSVGDKGNEAANNYTSQSTLTFTINNQRQAIMGVSMDEEMSNMMKFQYAYGASSRVINAMTDMLDTIIEKMGLAGR